MKTSAIILLFGVSLFVLSSCHSGRPLVNAPAQNNHTYNVQYLFEHEGCKVYRFYDQGNFVYFTNCNGDITAIKNDSTLHRVQTTGINRDYQ